MQLMPPDMSRPELKRSLQSLALAPKKKKKAIKQVDKFLVQSVILTVDVPQEAPVIVIWFQPPVNFELSADTYLEKWLDADLHTEQKSNNMVLLGVPVRPEELTIVCSHRDSKDEDAAYISSNEATPDKEESKYKQGVCIACNVKKQTKYKNKAAELECNMKRCSKEATRIILLSLEV